MRSRRGTEGAKPYTMKVVRTVLNGGDEETGLVRPRLVATQLESEVFDKLVQNSGEQLPAIARPITTGAPDGPHAGNVKLCISIFTF